MGGAWGDGEPEISGPGGRVSPGLASPQGGALWVGVPVRVGATLGAGAESPGVAGISRLRVSSHDSRKTVYDEPCPN